MPNQWRVQWDSYLNLAVKNDILCRAMLHDPDIYEDPDSFKPERFIADDGTLKADTNLVVGFGFGKRCVALSIKLQPTEHEYSDRICPGRHLVDSTFWMFVASVLSVFNITEDGTGDASAEGVTYMDGGIVMYVPVPF